MRRPLSLALGLFLVYATFVAVGGWFIVQKALHEVKPAVRQSTEETLVDTANLLAEIVSRDVARGTLTQSEWPALLERYGQRRPNAEIWGVAKQTTSHQIYIVDRHGVVLLDSTGQAVGKDFSQWRDVYLTLRGEYGARSTRAVSEDEASTVMYVAAPIYEGAQIIGSVTVAKANHTVEPFIVRAKQNLLWIGSALIAGGLAFGALLSYWLNRSIRRLTDYARRVSAGERVQVPSLPGGELAQLASALDRMRTELDGHAYVERYVQTLTHELKSPLSAIHAAAELLRGKMPLEKRERFLLNIETESNRLLSLCERLLNLAQLEKRRALTEREPLNIALVWQDVLERFAGRIEAGQLSIDQALPAKLEMHGERFLVSQALSNLLENALEFSPEGGKIRILAEATAASVELRVWNQGAAIPSYALPRLTERFYSLPRPSSGRKSTGLGLSFVQEVAELHQGQLEIVNADGGVLATLRFPHGEQRSGAAQRKPG